MSLRILLLQAREPQDPVIGEERAIFARVAGVPLENMENHNLLQGPPEIGALQDFDALMIGGSGEYFVSKGNMPLFSETMDFLRSTVDLGFPTFASCFGFQLLVKALGGEIELDIPMMELGTYNLTLTTAGQQDELFQTLPPVFCAQLGHKDRATRLPEGVLNLAASEKSPFQAMRIPGKPIWATQFHPEMTGKENLARLKRYIDEYTRVLGKDEVRRTIERFTESRETIRLVPEFIRLVFGNRNV